MAIELGLTEEQVNSDEFVRYFGADGSALPEMKQWATPYALCIYGQQMFQQCPFGNGNGYGDGRALSVAEVVVNGKRWELQLKGAGRTPFARTGDGRAVLRSSIREFLASEAMHHLGVSTTRALSLVASRELKISRPWYSDNNATNGGPNMDDPRLAHLPEAMRRMYLEQYAMRQRDPDRMVEEVAAITCRAAPSFIRIGHLDLFARRVRKDVPGIPTAEEGPSAELGLKQLEKLYRHAVQREFPGATSVKDFLERAGQRLATLTADWIRVGFVQGNFNSDNCLVAGRTMDYGPFGFMEKFDPLWNMWIGGGRHFAFLNQHIAGVKNYETLVESLLPLVHDEQMRSEIERMMKNQPAVAIGALNDVWRRKLGLLEWTEPCSSLLMDLIDLMHQSKADYTLFWRELARVLEVQGSFEPLARTVFYAPVEDAQRAAWLNWIERWRLEVEAQKQSVAEAVTLMRKASPKYVPREWMLRDAYDAAQKEGNMSLVRELNTLFLRPYDEQPEFEAKYYRRAPALGVPGVAYMS